MYLMKKSLEEKLKHELNNTKKQRNNNNKWEKNAITSLYYCFQPMAAMHARIEFCIIILPPSLISSHLP